MSVPSPERKESTAEFLETAKQIEREALKLYGRPCYADIKEAIMTDIYRLSSRLTITLVRANDIYTPNSRDRRTMELITVPKQQERLRLFVEAKGYLAALSSKITELYLIRPVKHRYRGQKKKLGILLGKEYDLLKGMIQSEETKLKKLK